MFLFKHGLIGESMSLLQCSASRISMAPPAGQLALGREDQKSMMNATCGCFVYGTVCMD